MGKAINLFAAQSTVYAVKMVKNKLTLILSLFSLILIIIMLTSTILAQTSYCNIDDMKPILRKALYSYLPAPELSKLNATEIKHLIDFYLNSSNLTTVRCDTKPSSYDVSYEDIINKFSNLTKDISIPTCEDGTLYGECSTTKPKYCFDGKLVNRCRVCGCSSGDQCEEDKTSDSEIHEGKWGKCMPIAGNVKIIEDIDGDGINETLTNTGIIGIGNISDNIITLSAFPEAYIGKDLNNDGDTFDSILRYYDINTGNLVITKIERHWGHSSENIIVLKGQGPNWTLKYYYIDSKTLIDTGINLDHGNGIGISNGVIAIFGSIPRERELKYYDINTGELVNTGITALNGDLSNGIMAFIRSDHTLGYYNINTNETTYTGISAGGTWEDDISIFNNIIAFKNTSREIKYYDINTGTLINTGFKGRHTLKISNNIIIFGIYEGFISEDLNNDGDTFDYILRYYDINTDRLVNIKLDDIDVGIVTGGISNNIIILSSRKETGKYVLKYITLSKPPEKVVISITCTDSDGGSIYNESGYVNSSVNGTFFDSCIGDTLTEFYCSQYNYISSIIYNCPYGCSNGACLEKITSFSDGSTVKNLVFNKSGKQTLYLKINKESNVTFSSLKLEGISNSGNFPRNPSLDIGNDGSTDWSYSGKFQTTEITADLSEELNKYLINTCQNGDCLIPFVFSSGSSGTLKISNLSVIHNTNPMDFEDSNISMFAKIVNFIRKIFSS